MGHTGGGTSRQERDAAYRRPRRLRVSAGHLDACARKRRYACEGSARAGAQYALTLPTATTNRLWVYRCEACRGWHMTSAGDLNQGQASVTAAELYAEDAL